MVSRAQEEAEWGVTAGDGGLWRARSVLGTQAVAMVAHPRE